jgi:excisionase family DNA binding protein
MDAVPADGSDSNPSAQSLISNVRLSGSGQMELLAKGEHIAEKMLTLREVSAYLNVNPATVRRLVRSGKLRAIRVGRDMRFEVRVVDQWVAAGGTLPVPGQSEPSIKIG